MTTIIEGMTPTEFALAINNNFPSKDVITTSMLTGELVTKFHSNYEYVKTIDSEIPTKDSLSIGMSGASYIARLNKNCQNIDNISPYKEYDYIIPNHRGSENENVGSGTSPCVLKLANGKTIIGCLSRGGIMSRECFAVIKNSDGDYSDPFLLGHDEGTTGTYDTHGRAAFVEKHGIIYGFHEELVGVSATTSGGHVSNFIVVKSLDEGVTWTEIARFGKPDVPYLYPGLSYPQVFIIGDDIYCFARLTLAAGAEAGRYIALWKSTDDGENWTQLTNPYDNEASGFWSYNTLPAGENDEINIIIVERSSAYSYFSFPHSYHIRSYDGITYYNTDRSWSKNVITNGSITRTESIAHCLIGTYVADNYTVLIKGSFIKNDKLYSLVICGQPSLDGGGVYTKLVIESCKIYEGKNILLDVSELTNGIEELGWGNCLFMSFARNGDGFDILKIDLASNNDIKLYNYSSTGLISTKLLRIGEVDSRAIQIGSNTFNAIIRNDRNYVMPKVTGDFLDLYNSYTDLIVFENNN